MSDTCTVCGTFDCRCNCFAGTDSAALPSSDAVVPSVAPAGTAPLGPVGATIAGEPGHPVPQAHPSYADMARAVQWCACTAAAVTHGEEAQDGIALALHAADVLRGFEAGAL